MTEKITKDLIRGNTDMLVLHFLEQEDSYGYAIAKKVKERSENEYTINEATLYTVFRRLEKNGEIVSYWGDETQGSRRKYYQITEDGKSDLYQSKKNWEFAKKIIDHLLEDEK
ncbi:PadR family transcriptional regulator [Pediococcus claussenii]|uniref:Transcriptional regulator, PadR-like family n=1 Tax=Pediococcus claussenii (strain ATCC BAA-344 / DSM 14800 / JCM 18046 / KCTC 3811 / LMG 21948 / P06) TaxID=701521 RepID=G8PB85_PEDCP|nr:PadR family transcriptional regulator [Pediococcus claussenii]AEV94714.1 transcriptional regulator, PadR-like family [Pediococcus claussenii ATCC BAA-344]ANZ69909.1 PadR family transcriptional regulator [Pediococcus claussenii]ANZ71726.1 PadR family transcriptional regulator [Pediococcus claussenii]KRN20893.1 hypothetical protein IV79_GL000118 [Pediococcus claussenii]